MRVIRLRLVLFTALAVKDCALNGFLFFRKKRTLTRALAYYN